MVARKKNQTGFTLVEVLVIVLVFAVIGALGFTFYGRMNQTAKESGESRIASDVQGAPEIKDTSDLDDAASILDQTDPASSDSDLSQLDSASSGF
jgi:type II secretory pathway component PulJ